MAPGAKLMAYDFGDAEQSLTTPFSSLYAQQMYLPAYNAGARVSSNSWGYFDSSTSSAAIYGYDSGYVDEMIFDNDDFLVIYAAGNYQNPHGDMSIGNNCVQKNSLCVGAAETDPNPTTVASFSSRGPAKDFRIKPDLVGPGDPVSSAKASGNIADATCSLSSKSGTSMATYVQEKKRLASIMAIPAPIALPALWHSIINNCSHLLLQARSCRHCSYDPRIHSNGWQIRGVLPGERVGIQLRPHSAFRSPPEGDSHHVHPFVGLGVR